MTPGSPGPTSAAAATCRTGCRRRWWPRSCTSSNGGEPFVYAYYDGIDKVAHEYGLDFFYDAELVFVDRMVEYLIETLPAGAALVITADHGQVDVGDRVYPPDPEVLSHVDAAVGRGSVPLAPRPSAGREPPSSRRPASTTATWHGW